jgi:hypothetical protein
MQTENELLAIAKKYGVPLPQTCIELDWQHETLFYWAVSKTSIFLMCNVDIKEEWVTCFKYAYNPYMEKWYFHPCCFPKTDFDIYAAPQMHEIVVYLNFDVDKLGNTIG